MKYIHSFCIVFQVLKVLLIKIFKIQSPNLFLLFYISFYICRYPIAPHSEITNKNPEITMNFYNDLNNLLNQINNKSSIVLVAGDFNGETGKKNWHRQMFKEFLWQKKKPKWTTPHKFMHKSQLINNKHMFQTQREKINNTGTNSYCTR